MQPWQPNRILASAFEQLAEQKIEEAIQNGFFDDLPNLGEKLDLESYFATPAHLRMSHSMLKSGGFVPTEVEMMQTIHQLEQDLENEGDARKAKFDAIAGDIWSVLANNHRIYYLVEDQRVVILDVILDAEIHSMEQG